MCKRPCGFVDFDRNHEDNYEIQRMYVLKSRARIRDIYVTCTHTLGFMEFDKYHERALNLWERAVRSWEDSNEIQRLHIYAKCTCPRVRGSLQISRRVVREVGS